MTVPVAYLGLHNDDSIHWTAYEYCTGEMEVITGKIKWGIAINKDTSQIQYNTVSLSLSLFSSA